MLKYSCVVILFLFSQVTHAQMLGTTADSLRGSLNANRTWYDVTHYNLAVTPNITPLTIQGTNTITFKVISTSGTMQLDLQQPLTITAITHAGAALSYKQIDNICLVQCGQEMPIGSSQAITITYNGTPRRALRAPWDGGLVWTTDDKGRPYVNTACQGLGASVWWPCKDHQSDEPDSMRMMYTVPNGLVAVGNGKLTSMVKNNDKTTSYTWNVTNPINTYCATMNIAHYANFTDTMQGNNGVLKLNYYVLDYNLAKAKKHFVQAKQTLRAFEYWFGPYPFYNDDYKLIETSHLGMEHQSAVAYGNKYMNGYLGNDLSGTGIGTKWDYIIVHESGHEWWGNNITTNDIADMWVHEGFTDYSETLFTEYYYGKKAADAYCQGLRANIDNISPIIGPYGINKEGSGDMYYKGANLIHTIRTIINNDVTFRNILRGLNKKYYHSTVNTGDIEQYISTQSGIDFSSTFDQYLRYTAIPTVQYYVYNVGKQYYINAILTNCIPTLTLPIPISNSAATAKYITLNSKAYTAIPIKNKNETISAIINSNIYINSEKVLAPKKL